MALARCLADLLLLAAAGLALQGIGSLVLRAAKVRCASRGERWFFSCAAGAGVAGYAVFALSASGLLYPHVLRAFLALLALTSLAGWRIAESAQILPALVHPA